jgi:hypothetical protein
MCIRCRENVFTDRFLFLPAPKFRVSGVMPHCIQSFQGRYTDTQTCRQQDDLMSLFFRLISSFLNRNSWEELIAYLPLVRRETHRKRRVQQFFFAAVTCLRNGCLTTIRGFTNRQKDTNFSFQSQGQHRKSGVQVFFYFWVCIHWRGNVFTEPLPSNVVGYTYRHKYKSILALLYRF